MPISVDEAAFKSLSNRALLPFDEDMYDRAAITSSPAPAIGCLHLVLADGMSEVD
jgi:hypothetical protein